MVPSIEEREASRANGYTWQQWADLPRAERVYGIAYFRARRLIDMHQNDEQEREIKRQQAKASKTKGRRR